MLIHSVFFWLRADLGAADRSDFTAEVKKLSAVPTISTIYVGGPAKLAERDVTERGFDVALTLVFKDAKAHDDYQVHPIHQAFVAKNKARWTKVIVYDSEE